MFRGLFLDALLAEIRACQICQGLPLGPRPLVQASAMAWLLAAMPDIKLVLVIGRYVVACHLPDSKALPLAKLVRGVERHDLRVLPHPSPRNRRWLRQNPWFEADVLPKLRAQVASLMAETPF